MPRPRTPRHLPQTRKPRIQEKKADDKSASDKMDLIPIDGEIAIADTFVPSAEKKKHIDKANEHLKSGRSKEAIEELRLGEVDVVFTRVMLPLESTKKRVADAEKLAGDHKYYEANLALKAAEEGIVIDAVDLMGTPTPASTASVSCSADKEVNSFSTREWVRTSNGSKRPIAAFAGGRRHFTEERIASVR